MKHSTSTSESLTRPARNGFGARAGVVLILLLAFAGLADSAYLVGHEGSSLSLLCSAENLSGCNMIAESPYARLLGIPLAELGVLFYAIVFATAALELLLFDHALRRVLQGLGALGVLASLYFVLIQTFVLDAFCIYCLASAFLALLICIVASLLEPLRQSTPLPAS